MYKHILVAHDGSALSDKAVAEAIRFAKQTGSKAYLLYVLPPLPFPGGRAYLAPTVRELERQHAEVHREQAVEMLESVQARFTAEQIPCEVLVEEGNAPYEHIVQSASRLNCDLVVMASHGHGGLEGLFVGSQTVKVLSHSKVPVLVVR